MGEGDLRGGVIKASSQILRRSHDLLFPLPPVCPEVHSVCVCVVVEKDLQRWPGVSPLVTPQPS